MNKSAVIYAIVDHTGSTKINSLVMSLQELHSANLVIEIKDTGRYSIIKDRYQSARELFGLTGLSLTRKQADEIIIHHVGIALKGMRS